MEQETEARLCYRSFRDVLRQELQSDKTDRVQCPGLYTPHPSCHPLSFRAPGKLQNVCGILGFSVVFVEQLRRMYARHSGNLQLPSGSREGGPGTAGNAHFPAVDRLIE